MRLLAVLVVLMAAAPAASAQVNKAARVELEMSPLAGVAETFDGAASIPFAVVLRVQSFACAGDAARVQVLLEAEAIDDGNVTVLPERMEFDVPTFQGLRGTWARQIGLLTIQRPPGDGELRQARAMVRASVATIEGCGPGAEAAAEEVLVESVVFRQARALPPAAPTEASTWDQVEGVVFWVGLFASLAIWSWRRRPPQPPLGPGGPPS